MKKITHCQLCDVLITMKGQRKYCCPEHTEKMRALRTSIKAQKIVQLLLERKEFGLMMSNLESLYYLNMLIETNNVEIVWDYYVITEQGKDFAKRFLKGE